MKTIRGYTLITELASGQAPLDPNTARVEFDVDTVDELPQDGKLDGYTLYQGSIAYVIEAAKFYVLDSEGVWHDAKNGAAYVPV